jgi:hypothetical protein
MWRKPFLTVTAICAALGLGAFVVAFFVTGDLTAVADEFLSTMARGDFEAAYALLSQEFHGNTSVAELRAFAQESALADYEEATWWHRSVSGDEGALDGEVETRSGEIIPVSIYLLREGGDWKIYQIDWESEAGVPDEATQEGAD